MGNRIQLSEAQLKRVIKEAVENVFSDNETGEEPLQKAQDSTGELEKRMMEVIKWYRKASFSNDIVKAQYYLDKLGTALNGLFKILEKRVRSPTYRKSETERILIKIPNKILWEREYT